MVAIFEPPPGDFLMATPAERLEVVEGRATGRIVSRVGEMVGLKRVAPAPSRTAILTTIAIASEGRFSGAPPVAAFQVAVVLSPPMWSARVMLS